MARMLRFAPLVLLLLAPTARAASISFLSSQSSVAAGNLYSLEVYVNAAGAPLVSSQFQLSYPPSLLKPLSFAFAPGWIQTFSPGTDLMGSGTVAQAGGYPSLFYGTELMGTLSFMALEPGTAAVTLSRGQTFIFKTEGGNLFDGSPASAEVAITPGTSPVLPPSSSVTSPPAPSFFAVNNLPEAVWGALLFLLLLLCGGLLWRTLSKRKRRR